MYPNTKLYRVAHAHGEPPEILIPRLLTEHGTLIGAARELSVDESTIRYWLRKNGYRRVRDGWSKRHPWFTHLLAFLRHK